MHLQKNIALGRKEGRMAKLTEEFHRKFNQLYPELKSFPLDNNFNSGKLLHDEALKDMQKGKISLYCEWRDIYCTSYKDFLVFLGEDKVSNKAGFPQISLHSTN